MKEYPLTPLMPISLILTMAIITAKYSHEYLNTHLWLIASILTWGMGAITFILGNRFRNTKKYFANYYKAFCRNISHQCLSLYLCIFCLGGLLTSHNIDSNNIPITVKSFQALSPIDRATLSAQSLRYKLEQKIQSLNIEEQNYAVILAMALGDKSALNAETKEDYSVAGTSHILAVSGLHIAIIFQVIILLLGSKRKSQFTIIISAIAVWAYVVLIGMPASAIRSALMISLYGFGLLANRQGPPINVLAFAYTIMLCFNPLSLFNISFQLSFLAVASILLFYPLIIRLYVTHHLLVRWAWQLISVSFAAQIGTMPIVAYYFGRVSCYSLFTSFVAIPMATLILYLCTTLVFFTILSNISSLTILSASILHLVASCLNSITQFGNSFFHLITLLPGASIDSIHISTPQVITLYIMIFCGYILWKKINHHYSNQVKIK